jgi:hypothetical protein
MQDEIKNPDWHGWSLKPKAAVLSFTTGGCEYEVNLHECKTSAQVCDWIFQISDKSWGKHAAVAGLVGALGDVLCPQGNLCSSGVEQGPLTSEEIDRAIAEYVDAYLDLDRDSDGSDILVLND